MDGFTAFKYWVAMKQHFTVKSFDVFKNQGRIKGSFEKYLARSDYNCFERIAEKFKPNEYIFYLAANMMYGNDSAVWDYGGGVANYNQFLKRRELARELYAIDIKTLQINNVKMDDGVTIIRMLTKNQVSFETVVLLNKYTNLVSAFDQLPQKIILEPLLIRIEKSIGFISIPKDVEQYILNYLQNKEHKNGI